MSDKQISFEQFIDFYTKRLDNLTLAQDNLDKLSVYDDVQAMLAYLSPLTLVIKNDQLGGTPKIRLKSIHDMAQNIYHDLNFDPNNPSEFTIEPPKDISIQSKKVLALCGRTNQQIDAIVNDSARLSEILYILIRTSEAAAYSLDDKGNINFQKAEEYLYRYFTKARRQLRLGKLIAPIIEKAEESEKQNNSIRSDIKPNE